MKRMLLLKLIRWDLWISPEHSLKDGITEVRLLATALSALGLSISRDRDSTDSLGNCTSVWLTSWWRNLLVSDHFTQALLRRHVLQLPAHLYDHLLDLLQYFHVCLATGMPKPYVVLQFWSHKSWTEGKNPFPWPTGCTVANPALFITRTSCWLTYNLWTLLCLQSSLLANECRAWVYSLLAEGFLFCCFYLSAEFLETYVRTFLQTWGLPKEQPCPPDCWSFHWV